MAISVGKFTGLDYWTGLLDWTTGLNLPTKSRFLHSYNHQKLLSVLSAHSIIGASGHLSCTVQPVYIVATPRHQINCRGALGR